MKEEVQLINDATESFTNMRDIVKMMRHVNGGEWCGMISQNMATMTGIAVYEIDKLLEELDERFADLDEAKKQELHELYNELPENVKEHFSHLFE